MSHSSCGSDPWPNPIQSTGTRCNNGNRESKGQAKREKRTCTVSVRSFLICSRIKLQIKLSVQEGSLASAMMTTVMTWALSCHRPSATINLSNKVGKQRTG
eukprot:9204053-Ditylum_brightwellii.AAC.1